MLRRLLLATDFSPAADAAWEFALDVAGQLRADVLLLHVAIPATLAATLPDRVGELHSAISRLAALTERGTARGVRVIPILREGEPCETIVDVARSEAVHLIVVGFHGRPSTDLLIGSVAERLVRVARCTVIVVKESDDCAGSSKAA